MNTWGVVLAAGSGSRLAEDCASQGLSFTRSKQFLLYQGAPLFWHAALSLTRIPALHGVVFVYPPSFEEAGDSFESLVAELDAMSPLGVPRRFTQGGARRQDSVANGLAMLPPECTHVLIHDSARPFASPGLGASVITGLASGHAAVIPGLPITDTVKKIDGSGFVQETPPRDALRAVQTPQGFCLAPLLAAHAKAREAGWDVTDDAMLMESCGHAVLVVPGEPENRKITLAADLELLTQKDAMAHNGMFLNQVPCNGLGYDVHKYGGDRPFILGGVPIACDVKVAAHSDGDTLLHALMDALLGCIGAGDIGTLFPDSDAAYDNISSGLLLSEVLERTAVAGLTITHVDITVIAQVPRIAPHRTAIAANVAKLLQLPPDRVNVKATTEEGLGFTGEKKGIKVLAQVSGLRPC